MKSTNSALKSVITTPDPRLRQKSRRVRAITDETHQIIADMTAASLEWEKQHPYELSAAMAAPQLGINQRIINVGKSGLGGIDIVNNFSAYAANPNLLSNYINLYDSKLTYLNLDRAYWNQNYISSAEAFGKLFVVVGDVNLSVFDRTIITYFNQTQCEARGITGLYQTVLDGDWTYETFYEMVRNVHEVKDMNDPSKDFYGLTTIRGSEASDGILYSFDGWMTQTAEDGTHSLVTGSGIDKLSDIMDQLQTLMYSEGVYMHTTSQENYDMFTEGRALFKRPTPNRRDTTVVCRMHTMSCP